MIRNSEAPFWNMVIYDNIEQLRDPQWMFEVLAKDQKKVIIFHKAWKKGNVGCKMVCNKTMLGAKANNSLFYIM
jgi:hypothetical protein